MKLKKNNNLNSFKHNPKKVLLLPKDLLLNHLVLPYDFIWATIIIIIFALLTLIIHFVTLFINVKLVVQQY